MSLRIETPPPFRAPTLLDAVNAPSHEHRRLFLEHIRANEKHRAAQLRAMSDATLHTAPQISGGQKPKVNVLHQGCR